MTIWNIVCNIYVTILFIRSLIKTICYCKSYKGTSSHERIRPLKGNNSRKQKSNVDMPTTEAIELDTFNNDNVNYITSDNITRILPDPFQS
ncbi:hypothetical protein EB796_022633 [Bugula neritina]|uniref:Uncharacterized protein n=1 Tax=Bugula neritina TaxID=10212 RepID=A0A7J7J0U4_BUGNE|nr:hypothetical protein EB796_022633 [Bugula neritina]